MYLLVQIRNLKNCKLKETKKSSPNWVQGVQPQKKRKKEKNQPPTPPAIIHSEEKRRKKNRK